MRVNSIAELNSVKGYLARIGAEVRSMRTAVVREEAGNYWKDIAVIRFGKDGTISTPEGFEPTDLEAAQIKAECLAVEWPHVKPLRKIEVWPEEVQKAIDEGRKEDVFEFRDAKGELIMLQLRKEDREGGKAYIPFTFWDDDVWRKIEPEGPLPLWGLENINKSTTVFIHEGAKAARAMHRLTNPTNEKERKKLAAHPWGEELSHAVHLGWIGGALSPFRTDWSALKKSGVKRAYIVSDNDPAGQAAVPNVAYHLNMPTFQVQFTNEWDTSFDLADDFPEAMFSEMDGHRYYIGPAFRSCLHPATWATDLLPNPRGKPSPILRDHFKDLWAYVEEADMFVCTEMPEIIRSEAVLNKMLAAFSHTPDTCKLLVKSYRGRSTKLSYRPDIEGRVVTDRTKSAINLHTPTNIKIAKGSEEPWLEFMRYLIPREEERKAMEKWCATIIARPDIKMEYGVLAVSEHQGIGKTTLASAILAPLVGFQNVGHPTENDIVHSDFNEWLANKRLVVVNEIYSGHSWKAYNRLKSYITDKEVTVNVKYQRPYTIENWAHIFACSNSLKALKMEEDDRRWFYPEITEVSWKREKFAQFHAWLKGGGLGIIRRWAHEQDEYVLPGQRAPMTYRKKELIASSRSEAQREVVELAEAANQREEPIGFAMKEIEAWVRSQVQGRVFDSDMELRKAMKEAGCHPYRNRIQVGGRMQFVVMNRTLTRSVEGLDDDEARKIIREAMKQPNQIVGDNL